jgi:hypothetical protein
MTRRKPGYGGASMKFVAGHDKRKVEYVSAKVLKDKFSQTKGYFYSEFDWNDSGIRSS